MNDPSKVVTNDCVPRLPGLAPPPLAPCPVCTTSPSLMIIMRGTCWPWISQRRLSRTSWLREASDISQQLFIFSLLRSETLVIEAESWGQEGNITITMKTITSKEHCTCAARPLLQIGCQANTIITSAFPLFFASHTSAHKDFASTYLDLSSL